MRDLYKGIIDIHSIEYLCHFTSIQNFVNICKYGILSRTAMEDLGIKYVVSDQDRFDGQFDKISISITIPNPEMFMKKNYKEKPRWIIMMLDPTLLMSSEIIPYFCETNASSNKMINKLNTNSEELITSMAFENMFYRKKEHIMPKQYPTDSQAEILIKGKIDIKYIKKIIVYDTNTQKILEEICSDWKLLINIFSEPRFFQKTDFRN